MSDKCLCNLNRSFCRMTAIVNLREVQRIMKVSFCGSDHDFWKYLEFKKNAKDLKF